MTKMFPSKSMVDYMTEMNRLFPRPEHDLHHSNAYSLAAQSPFNYSTQSPFNSTVNRSSSSTDSTSPESFPEISVFKLDSNIKPIPETHRSVSATPTKNYEPRPMYETPKSSETQFLMRHQRPIVGRKIFNEPSPQAYERVQASPVSKIPEEYEFSPSIWQDEYRLFQQPPQNPNIFIENKHYTQYYEPRPMYETPKSTESQFLKRQQRPIIGRKIFAEPSPSAYERVQVSPIPLPVLKLQQEYEFPTSIWHDENDGLFQQTPPNFNHIFIENKNYTQNFLYDLFPAENKNNEFKTPVKTSPTPSTHSNVSPMSNLSPTMSHSPMGANPHLYQRSPSFASSSRSQQQEVADNQKLCSFCRKNGERPAVYLTHMVKEKIGNKFIVSCPILRKHICSICDASGDNAHTITYCPVLRSNNNGQPLQSTTVTLKTTRVKSNGRRRY